MIYLPFTRLAKVNAGLYLFLYQGAAPLTKNMETVADHTAVTQRGAPPLTQTPERTARRPVDSLT